jgi:hypothetical protein
MRKNRVFIVAMAAVLLTFGVVLTGCGKSEEEAYVESLNEALEGTGFQLDTKGTAEYLKRAQGNDGAQRIIWGIVIVAAIAAIGFGIYWTYLKNNNPDKLPSFMKNLWGIKPKQDGASGDSASVEASAPTPRSAPETTDGASPGAALERWQKFLLVFVCGNALSFLINLTPLNQTPVSSVVSIIAHAFGAIAFWTSKSKALSAIKKPCAVATGICAVCALYFLLKYNVF